MSVKYDWLENFVLVYNDLVGFDKHCFGGHSVSILHRNGKCGIIFYRKKDEAPRFSQKLNQAYDSVNDDWCGYRFGGIYNAEKCYDDIVAKANARRIERIGFAVITL